ncbi:MAG TPA: hypothetical protein VJN71_06040 [Nitrososphaerales archaeon]|nr:hypothetical protein [Nitrososphaerales archaeon]
MSQFQEEQTKGDDPDYHLSLSIMPPRVSPVEVFALTQSLQKVGSLELSDLARRFPKQSSPHFLSIMRAAVKLGLIKRDGSIINITDLGISFLLNSDRSTNLVRNSVGRLEPVKTTLEILSKKKIATHEEIASTLKNLNPGVNQA